MSTVIKMEDFKKRQRRRYLKTHHVHIERFIERFISVNAPVSIDDFVHQYQLLQRNNCQDSWDYLDLRELIIQSLEKSIGKMLANELAAQPWYDERWLSWERILEHCLAALVAKGDEHEDVGNK